MTTKPISRHTRRKLASAMGTPSCAEQLCDTIDSLVTRVNELELEVALQKSRPMRASAKPEFVSGTGGPVKTDKPAKPEPAIDPVVAAGEPALSKRKRSEKK